MCMLCCKLTRATAGATTRYMLATLSGNPNVRTEWFWSFTFAFAISSSYLDADDFVNMKQVVCKCLLQFASYLAGVGIPGMLPERFCRLTAGPSSCLIWRQQSTAACWATRRFTSAVLF